MLAYRSAQGTSEIRVGVRAALTCLETPSEYLLNAACLWGSVNTWICDTLCHRYPKRLASLWTWAEPGLRALAAASKQSGLSRCQCWGHSWAAEMPLHTALLGPAA